MKNKIKYFINEIEYSFCCDYPIIFIKNKNKEKIKYCNQCLKELTSNPIRLSNIYPF